MKDFDTLKELWQQSLEINKPGPPTGSPIYSGSKTIKMKLEKTQLHGAIALSLTAVLIACVALFGRLHFIHWYTYGAMALICLICLLQAGFMYWTYHKIKQIDDMAAPSEHLQQWKAYFDLRKSQNKWNMPVYYILLNIAMSIYLIECFTGRPVLNVVVFVSIYASCMLLAYFFSARKNIKRETSRLQNIVDELTEIDAQLKRNRP